MEQMTFTKQNLDNMTMTQLKRIQANQYRSVDNSQDFCPFSIENRIIEIEIKRAEMLLKTVELAYDVEADENPIDPQMIALMTVTEPGRAILAMITKALFDLKSKKLSNDGELTKRALESFEAIESKQNDLEDMVEVCEDCFNETYQTGGKWSVSYCPECGCVEGHTIMAKESELSL